MSKDGLIQVTGGTGTSNTYEDCQLLKFPNDLPYNFVFRMKNEEIMKITPEGFFWKGKLVENDKEIYQNFKEFLNMSK
jgi:hypothetical protein